MGIKELMHDTESKRGKWAYTKMLNWLDSPNRKLFDAPEKLVKSSGIEQGHIVLEIGCGSGFFTEEASKLAGSSGMLYATDIHEIAIEQTKKKVDAMGLKNVIVQKDDALNSAFEDCKFDRILLYGVVPAPVIPMKDISEEMCRVLKPGGICAIWTKVPFWSPKEVLKHAPFESIKKENGVFLLQKKH